MWDMTVGNQLAGVYGIQPGLERPQAYPYLTELGDVYALANFEQAADYADKDSMLDWESETLSNYTTGTIAIASGVVTLTGGAFPNYGGNPVYPLRLYVGSTIYSVASYDSATQLTLTNLTVNASAGTSYKFASWDYRETDPFYAANDGEWQQAHNEFAHALSLIDARAFNNRARVGVYELPVMTWRRDVGGQRDGELQLYNRQRLHAGQLDQESPRQGLLGELRCTGLFGQRCGEDALADPRSANHGDVPLARHPQRAAVSTRRCGRRHPDTGRLSVADARSRAGLSAVPMGFLGRAWGVQPCLHRIHRGVHALAAVGRRGDGDDQNSCNRR
jgi:hypothetical protein